MPVLHIYIKTMLKHVCASAIVKFISTETYMVCAPQDTDEKRCCRSYQCVQFWGANYSSKMCYLIIGNRLEGMPDIQLPPGG